MTSRAVDQIVPDAEGPLRPKTSLSPKTDSRPVQDRLPAVGVGRNFSPAMTLDGRVREVTNGSFGAAKLVESLGT